MACDGAQVARAHVIRAGLQRRIRAHVKGGGLIAYPTASCFGLGCDPQNARALVALLRIKRRPKRKGLILISDRLAYLTRFLGPLSEDERRVAESHWPGPHTWLIRASRKALPLLRGRHDKLAVRVDAHAGARQVARVLRGAIVSTSLNRAGRRPIKTMREARRQFGQRVLVVPGRIGTDKRASVIQDLQSGRNIRT
jgi:L-threonylcarbamoyladenylate synthase